MMRERAELLDGTLSIESSERGTRVLVLVPLGTGAL
jgi:signal transduction histidine kinase